MFWTNMHVFRSEFPLYVEDKQEDIMLATCLGHFLLFTYFPRFFPLPDGLRSLCSRVGTLVLMQERCASDSLKFDSYVYRRFFKGNCEFVAALNCFDFEFTMQTPQTLVNGMDMPNWWFRNTTKQLFGRHHQVSESWIFEASNIN